MASNDPNNPANTCTKVWPPIPTPKIKNLPMPVLEASCLEKSCHGASCTGQVCTELSGVLLRTDFPGRNFWGPKYNR